MLGRRIHTGVAFGRRIRRIPLDKAPQLRLVLGRGHRREVQQHRERHNHIRLGHIAPVDMPNGVVQLALVVLRFIGAQLLVVFVDRLGDHVEIHALGRLGLEIHEIRQRFRAGIGQPFVDGQTIARRFGDLVPVLIKEQLIGKMLGRAVAQNTADLVIDRRVGAVILAVHLKVDIKGGPTGAKVGLPLQLHIAAGQRQGHFGAIFIVEGDRAFLGVDRFHRHIHYPPRFRVDRQEDRIGLPTLLAQRLQHHFHDLVILFSSAQKHLVELAGAVEFRGRDKLVLEPEGIQKTPQHGVVMRAKAVVFAERIGHRCQRALQMFFQCGGVGHVTRHLAHPVQIVGKAHQPRRNVADLLKCAADHRRARNFAEGPDMRQTRRAIAGLEQDVPLLGGLVCIAFQHPTCFLERPRFTG